MDRIIDEIVEVSLEDAAAAAASTAVNTVAVLGITTSAASVAVIYGKDELTSGYAGDLTNLAKSYFSEKNNGRLVLIPVTAAPTGDDIDTTLDAALNMGRDASGREVDFFHVVLRIPTATSTSDAKALIDTLETWCQDNFRMGHVEFENFTTAKAVAALYAADSFPELVSICWHNDSTNHTSLAAAIVADRCYDDPARGTWAHKTLKAVPVDSVSKGDFKDAKDNGINIYCKVAGVNRFYFGTIGCNPKDFIDAAIKKMWLKFRTQESVFDILGSANNGDGVDYSDPGIDSIVASINSILAAAAKNDRRYIMPDTYSVEAPKFDEIEATDKAVRNLPKVKAVCYIQHSIHTVKRVTINVF